MVAGNETLSKLLGSLYAAAADPALWEPFLEQLAQSTRATSAAMAMHDLDHTPSAIWRSWELDPKSIRLYQEHYYALDTWTRSAQTYRPGDVRNSELLCPLSELKSGEFYNDFLALDGIEHGMFGILERSKSRLASVSLYRDKSRSAFTRCDSRILQFLVPHLQRAFRLHFRLFELRARSEGFEAALDMLPTGIIFIGPKGEVVLMNHAASAVVSESDGLLATRSGLRAERPAESSLLEKTIREATCMSNGHGALTGGTVLVSRHSRAPLQILVSPIRNSAIHTSQAIAAVAFITDPTQRQRPRQDVLRAMFGLTPAECRVALLLGDGHAPRKIADMIGVTDNTVRSQIKSIFSKTGVKRQGELIGLLLSNSGLATQGKQTFS